MNQMEYAFREKIYRITFVFSIFVIWIHSYNSELFLGQSAVSKQIYLLEHLFGETVGQIAVPGFFLISSFLFFRNYSFDKIWDKWKLRIRSILIPFLLWNFVYYAGYVIATRIPGLSDIVGKGRIPFDVVTAADAILFYRYNYVFWYLYQLILLIIIAPVLYYLLKRKWSAILLLLIECLVVAAGADITQLNSDALFYYTLGAYAAIWHRAAFEKKGNETDRQFGMLLAGIAAVILAVWLRTGYEILLVVQRVLAAAAVWFLLLPCEGRAKVFMKHNFWLYAVHFALVRLVNKSAAHFLYGNSVAALALYLCMPAVMAAVSFASVEILKKNPVTRTIVTVLSGKRE